MKIDKKSISIFAMLLLASMVFTIIAFPNVNASTPPKTWPTVAYLSVSPNPIGVGQSAIFIMFIDKAPPTATGSYGDRFTGYTLNITEPDGTVVHLGPFNADAISSTYTRYSPETIGNYTAVFDFPAQVIKGANPPPASAGGYQSYNHPDQINDTYAESVSNTVTLVVTDTTVANWPEAPLPTDYWTRPINAWNRGWAVIAGDWLGGAANPGPYNYGQYLSGPESAHVLWTKPMWEGGIAGGNAVDYAYDGLRSEGGGPNPMIINGKIYYADQGTTTGNTWGWYAVDLYSGATIYYKNGTTNVPSFGQVLRVDLPEGNHGPWDYLWSTSGTTWTAMDPYTGNVVFSIANVSSSGTAIYSNKGDILRYNIVNLGTTASPKMYLQVWNTTQALEYNVAALGESGQPTRFTGIYDGRNGFSLNASIPAVQGSIFEVVENQYVVGGTQGKHNDTAIVPGNIWKISLSPDNIGTMIENITFTPPQSIMDPTQLYQYGPYGTYTNTFTQMFPPLVYSQYNIFVMWEGATRRLWGFDLTTGAQIWGPTEPQENVYMGYRMIPAVANGIFYTGGHRGGGEVHAYNITTGESLWKWNPGVQTFEDPFSSSPAIINTIADGKVYLTSNEHSPSQPLRRDAEIICLNATTGVLIWKLPQFNGEIGSFALSSGYAFVDNIYDDNWYCIGKGPSATTVTASPKVSMHGSTVLVEGTVTDQSPGAPGTAAISDADQEAWMEYLYMQQTMPFNVKGVTVSLNALDPNGNFVPIGTVTSDASGMFKKSFTPEIPGDYTIVASFAGSKSYGSSSAETAISVSEAPSPTNAPTTAPQSMADIYFLPVSIAIIIAIIVVGIVLSLLLLRKRP
jgi:hypothetical protein